MINNRQTLLDSIQSSYWPQAVPPTMIVNSKESRDNRAKTIINNFIHQPLKGRKFLDFGCGLGDCVKAASNAGAVAIGYDKHSSDEWAHQQVTLTTEMNTVIENGPYDVVLMYDVIDHMTNDMLEAVFWDLRKAIRPNTTFYVRCHPYSSRHGTHLYETYNKAYAHLFLTNQEIINGGGKIIKTFEIIDPVTTYPAMFEKLGFNIINTSQVITAPEPNIEQFMKLLMPVWYAKQKKTVDQKHILSTISIQFIDYVLKANMCFKPTANNGIWCPQYRFC